MKKLSKRVSRFLSFRRKIQIIFFGGEFKPVDVVKPDKRIVK